MATPAHNDAAVEVSQLDNTSTRGTGDHDAPNGSHEGHIVSERTPLIGRPSHSGSIGSLSNLQEDIEARWTRWKDKVARLAKPKKGGPGDEAQLLISLFTPAAADGNWRDARSALPHKPAQDAMSTALHLNVDRVRAAIAQGIYPKMITTGSSGSYFARAPVETQDAQLHVRHEHEGEATALHHNLETVAVFKPQDEEPYGNLNPKRVFLRKYLWWAMGRPCLIPNFSAFSEVGASYLDVRLELGLVPRTELIELSSPSFHYEFKDRMLWDRERRWPPQKLGSWQTFLPGYRNASDFLRAHPWPSRPRSLLEHDLEAEQRAHSKARKRQSKKLRTCVVSLKNVILCRQGYEPDDEDEGEMEGGEGTATTEDDGFLWNPDNMQSFRLELEKLVCLDYLQRNTDRGLDNFMLHPYTDEEGKQRIALGAIDNSLAFPHKHPVGIRSYPMGWLYLPVDLIGGPFSASTRVSLIPMLSSPRWWLQTVRGLREIFQRDEHFDPKLFERQMALMRGQGWNLLQSLRSEDEGPLELCARQKQVVKQEKRRMTPSQIADTPGSRVALFQPVTHAQGYEPDDEDEGEMEGGEGTAATEDDGFLWNPDNMQSFRLELEKPYLRPPGIEVND
ncbi:Phosphatidylinositol 4-kinase [Ceraceosorus bombacis]|uniref:Phosphatidylinositol 4-kinase n=1 Tax=Ceraceosorus bombacis TaxID=401625 RepID=A0A0P1BC18_9BASI|nr:Phosphatidylinositol 4-kinase [Ceraceosorus bombacis]